MTLVHGLFTRAVSYALRLGGVSDDSSKAPLAVFDLDNTLADTTHRQRFLERTPKDWNGFFSAAPQDPPVPEGVALVRERARECEIVYLTGRPERCRRDTLEWLAAQGLPEGRVYMRRDADRRPSYMACSRGLSHKRLGWAA